MGGISAQTGKRQGEAGAIVQGGVRDIAHSRAVGYPVWASDITPVTGKWRIETVEINGPIADRRRPGGGRRPRGRRRHRRLLHPARHDARGARAAEKKAKAEAIRCKAIDDGVPVPDMLRSGEVG